MVKTNSLLYQDKKLVHIVFAVFYELINKNHWCYVTKSEIYLNIIIEY